MKKLVAIVALAAAPVLFAQEKKLSNATKSEVSKVEQEKIKADAERKAEAEKMKKAAAERRAQIKKENKNNKDTKANVQSKSVK